MSDKPNNQQPANPFKPYEGRFQSYHRIPEKGRHYEDIYKEIETMATEENTKWQSGQASGTFYHAGEEHRAFMNKVFALYSHINVIQADLCPSMSKFEAEIVSMTAGMLNAEAVNSDKTDDQVCGTLTSGGSESILMAMKVYRDKAKTEKGIDNPEVILPGTAHSAFRKADEYFGMKMIHLPCELPDFRVDPKAVEAAITSNTVAIVGSAGNYPYGLIDPMEELSEIALKHKLWMHIDGCLGGFILPWVEKLGYRIPPFDFRLPGLTSMSADTHKFGYGLKGTSVVLYRNKDFRKYQYFTDPDWVGGTYLSPSASGSRSGGLTASMWAAMVNLGVEGYLSIAGDLMKVADEIKAGIETIPELTIIGDPTFIISFRSEEVDVYHVNDFLKEKGWRFNVFQHPPALHFCVTRPQTVIPGVAERLIKDLTEGVEYAKSKTGTHSDTSAIYGISGSTEGNRMINELLHGYLDLFYTV
ncbi:MAG: aspartate aminotransferase family protein [Proteobacteria bacterium]|nr:aspartate aminotransferase family protein [Pseudomonadota bacterium]